jgi:hypothetical protein
MQIGMNTEVFWDVLLEEYSEMRACQNTDKMEDSLTFENPRMARNCLARNPMVVNLAFCTICPSLRATFHLEFENHS